MFKLYTNTCRSEILYSFLYSFHLLISTNAIQVLCTLLKYIQYIDSKVGDMHKVLEIGYNL